MLTVNYYRLCHNFSLPFMYERATALLLLTMAPEKIVKQKVQTAAQAYANTRKKQRVSLDSVEILHTDSEITTSLFSS